MSASIEAKKKKSTAPWVVVTLAVIGLVAGLVYSGIQSFWVAGPHELMATRAVLDPELEVRVRAAKDPMPRKMSEAIARALALTDELLHPGAGTATGAGAVLEPIRVPAAGMEANGGDYAHAYAAVLGTLLRELNINHRIHVVRSPSASALGRDFGPHHWVYIQELRQNVLLAHYVDPQLHDRFGRYNLYGRVEEPIPVEIPGTAPAAGLPTAP